MRPCKPLLLPVLLLLGASLPAQIGGFGGEKVSLSARMVPDQAAPGTEVTLEITVGIVPGYHIYGSLQDPDLGDPTRLVIQAAGPLVAVDGPRFPEGERHDTLGLVSHWVSSGAILEQTFRVPDDARSGPVEVVGKVTYMACTELMCDPPAEVAFTVILRVSKATWTAEFVPRQASPGERVTLKLTGSIMPGHHIYGGRQSGVTTSLSIQDAAGLESHGTPSIPGGEEHDILGTKSYWVSGAAVLEQEFVIPVGMRMGSLRVDGKVDYAVSSAVSSDPAEFWSFAATLEVVDEQVSFEPIRIPGDNAGPRLFLDAHFVPATARPGEQVTLEVEVFLEPGWHIYGSEEKDGIPTVLSVEDIEGLSAAGEALIPPGKEILWLGLNTHQLEDVVVLKQVFTVPDDASPGSLDLSGLVGYTACDEFTCDPYKETRFFAALNIEAGEARAQFLPRDPLGVGGSLWLLILAAVGTGLFALAMPCTYPMIPITFSFFTKQADVRGGRVLPLALSYGAGIVGIFVLIGLFVGPIIVSYATHWITNLIIGLVFLVFAFVLFGWLTLKTPRFLDELGNKGVAMGGYWGVFLMGGTLVFATFTCTAPFLATLLTVSASGESIGRVAMAMAVFGATMAVPFVFLSLVPGKIKALPRSGEWMNTLKVSLGFVELAAALKFFSNVDLVREWSVLPKELFLVLWTVIFGALGLYLFGVFSRGRASVGKGRVISAVASIALAIYCLVGAKTGELGYLMTAIAPPYPYAESLYGSGEVELGRHTIVKDDHDAAVAQAKGEGKLVLINFTGHT